MNTADVAMDYGSIETVSGEIEKMKAEFDDMCLNLNTLVRELDGQWQGNAQTEFAAAYSKLEPKLESIGNIMGDFSAAVLKAACVMKETDSQIKL